MTPHCLLLPGLLCDEAVWTPQLAQLREFSCQVASYGALDSIESMARSVLDSTPAPRLAVVGHSMGGRVALEMARQAPERVVRLALLDTGIEPLPDGDAGARERAGRMALLQLARERGMRAMGRQWALGMVHPSRLDTPLFDTMLDMIERKTPQIFEAQIRALLARPDAREVFRRLQCPVLLGCGRQDAWSPLARHEQMQALLPGSRLVAFEDCGHMSTLERPAAVSTALQDWMRGG